MGLYEPTVSGMRVLYVTDRLSTFGGADLHLLSVIRAVSEAGARVSVAYGHEADPVDLPAGARRYAVRIRGLAGAAATDRRLEGLEDLLDEATVVHAQNVMNPVALDRVVSTGRAVVTVQDHRVFCPGPGKTLPGGRRCEKRMSLETCRRCLRDGGYLRRMMEVTTARARALEGARLVALSRYMADELRRVGMPGAAVIPPWVDVAPPRTDPGDGFLLAGRLVHHKAPLDAWRAWLESETSLPLRVSGAGSFSGRLEGAENLGWLEHERFTQELRGARAVLFPAFWQEPFGIVGLEALAQGTPVIVAEGGGTSDWSRSGCFPVPPGDVGAMAERMQRLANRPRIALKAGEEGRRFVAEAFASRSLLPELLAVYAETAGGTTHPGPTRSAGAVS